MKYGAKLEEFVSHHFLYRDVVAHGRPLGKDGSGPRVWGRYISYLKMHKTF